MFFPGFQPTDPSRNHHRRFLASCGSASLATDS
ncbi:MAG: hypothetical protein JNK85_07220 [Verrucomicrobiales bacterium]|nr:hypothetical protein [Verrucomicrobiales bacterium]